MYYGYYRESAKHKTQWICVCKSENRAEVTFKLKQQINRDRAQGHLGSRIKIIKE